MQGRTHALTNFLDLDARHIETQDLNLVLEKPSLLDNRRKSFIL